MCRKLFLLGLGAAALLAVGAKTNLGSYCTTAYRRATGAVQDTVPLEFQIDRARNMVRDLEPEIRQSMHVIAKEEVEVGELNKRIETAESRADKEKGGIIRLQSDLSTGKHVFRYAGRRYSSDEVKNDLTRRFNRFKTADATLSSMRQMRDARARNLDAAREKLTAMVAAQRQLRVEVENLEAQLKLVQVAEASSDFQFDDSQLARCKELMTDIRTRLDVAAKLANADASYAEEINLDEPEHADIAEEVAHYFGLKSRPETEVATASFAK